MPWTRAFEVSHEKPKRVQVLDSSDGENASQACNKAFAGLVSICKDQDLFKLNGEEYEEFAIVGVNYPARLYRYAAPLFGISVKALI